MKQNEHQSLYVLGGVVLVVFTYIVLEVSGDYVNYEYGFAVIENWATYISGENALLAGYNFEPGYVALELFIKSYMTTDTRLGVALLALLGLIGLICQLPKYSKYSLIALVVYFAHFYWWLGLVLIRQMIAMAILFPVISFWQEKKYWKSLIFVGLASLFHSSALLMILFLIFSKLDILKNSSRVTWSIMVSLFLGIIKGIGLVVIYAASFIPRGDILANYLINSSGVTFNPIAYAEMLLLFVVSYKNRITLENDNKYSGIAIQMLLFSLIVCGLFFPFEIATRFAMLFNFYAFLILIPSLFVLVKQNIVNRLMMLFGLVLYMAIFLIRFVAVTAEVDFIP